jgi:hypothetical protein
MMDILAIITTVGTVIIAVGTVILILKAKKEVR